MSPKPKLGIVPCPRCDSPDHGHFAGPEVCPRYYRGPRNRRLAKLRVASCVGCGLAKHLREYGERDLFGTAGQLLVAHGFDASAALADVAGYDGSFWEAVRLNLERARRNDSFWTPEHQ